jgi:hypothetical protein
MQERESPIAIAFIMLCGFSKLSHNRFEGVSKLYCMLAVGCGFPPRVQKPATKREHQVIPP